MSNNHYYERPNFTERPLLPYVIAVGQVALAWNHLHEYLGRFFGLLSGSGSRTPLIAAWQALQADRAKRAMLNAAWETLPEDTARKRKIKAEVKWILDRAQSLEDARNDAVHAPLYLSLDLQRVADEVGPEAKAHDFIRLSQVQPMDIGDNTRAKKLTGRAVLAEYRWCRDCLLTLRNHVQGMDAAMAGNGPLPKRPTLPSRPGSRSGQPGRRSAQV